MKTDHFSKVGGKRASEGGGATNTRPDARFPSGSVGKVQSSSTIDSDESFWGAVKLFSANIKT